MKKQLVNTLQFLVFAGIGAGILYYFFQTQQAAFSEQCKLDGVPAAECSLLRKLANDFRSVNLFWISLVLLAFTLSNISRAVRWRMLLKGLGHEPKLANAFYAVMISYTTNLWMSRMGEVVRGGTITKYEKIPLSKVMGTIIIDRLMDFISLIIIVGLAFLLQFNLLWTYLQDNMPKGNGNSILTNPIVLSLGAFFLILSAVAYYYRERFEHSAFYQKMRVLMLNMFDGLKTVRSVEHPKWFIFHSINIWVMYYFMTYLCFFAFEPTSALPPVAALTVFVFGTFGMVIPSPGGMGTYHLLCTAALLVYGINKIDAFSFANIMFFSINIFYNLAMGIFAFIMLPITNRDYQPLLHNSDEDALLGMLPNK